MFPQVIFTSGPEFPDRALAKPGYRRISEISPLGLEIAFHDKEKLRRAFRDASPSIS
jgi:hypothetical protein